MMAILQIIFMGMMVGFMGAGVVMGYIAVMAVMELINRGVGYIIDTISNKFKGKQ